MTKSPREIARRGTVLAALMTVVSTGWTGLWTAQDAPQAPAPKPEAAAPATSPAAREQNSAAQPAPPQEQSDTRVRIRASVNLVVLPVTVKDGSGNLVPDLTKEEFRVFDDNVEQKVSIFTI